MLFNSYEFAIFLPIVFAVYWLMPHKYRWIVVLISSYYFYMSWNAKYVFLILFTTIISYGAGRLLEIAKKQTTKKWIVAGSCVASLGVLFFFKYFNFLSESIATALSAISIHINPITLDLILPVGISFYTFQTLSYVIDVYRGNAPAEHHFGYYAAFISFFPQLVAGPIERTSNLLPQIKEEHKFNYNQGTYGLKLMAWGFFKKLVIADVISDYVQVVYDNPTEKTGFALVLATLFFTIQIYCDFSGYSDIAIGCAKLLGINLMTNFKSPYFSQSIKEFWSRWHISLSTWFKDYVYIPLGGNRVSKSRHAFNLIVTFLLSGLWHGANWTFVIWGGIHGLAQEIEDIFLPKEKRNSDGLLKAIRVVFVFIFAAFGWIFFVSNSLRDAVYVISHLFDGITNPVQYLSAGISQLGIGTRLLAREIFFIVLLGIFDYINLKQDPIELISSKKPIVRHLCYWALILIIVFFRAGGAAEFVYFQF